MPQQASPRVEPDKIQIVDMRIVHASIDSPIEFEIDKIADFKSISGCNLSFHLEDKMVKSDFDVTVQSKSEEGTNQQEVNATFKLTFFFVVENLDELATVKSDETIELKGGLEGVLASITYSTSRGILMTRFQGTAFQDFILPVINPKSLFAK
jgi:hypothetical protein